MAITEWNVHGQIVIFRLPTTQIILPKIHWNRGRKWIRVWMCLSPWVKFLGSGWDWVRFFNFVVKHWQEKYFIHIENVRFEFQEVIHYCMDGPISKYNNILVLAARRSYIFLSKSLRIIWWVKLVLGQLVIRSGGNLDPLSSLILTKKCLFLCVIVSWSIITWWCIV